MDDTIDRVFEAPQETYEELLGKFIFLSQPNGDYGQNYGYADMITNEVENGMTDTAELSIAPVDNDTEEIPVEELGAGFSLAPSMDRALASNKTLIPQIGNFVDSDTDSSEASSLSDLSDSEEYEPEKNTEQDFAVDMQRESFSTSCNSNDDSACLANHSSDAFSVLNQVHNDDPLPGEVIDDHQASSINVEVQVTNLEIRTTMKMDTYADENKEHQENSEEHTIVADPVEEFTLDENFDYDNVELTPKTWNIKSDTVEF